MSTLLERIAARGFTVTASGCPPVLHVEPADALTDTQRATIATHEDDLRMSVLFPWVNHEPSLALVRALGDGVLEATE